MQAPLFLSFISASLAWILPQIINKKAALLISLVPLFLFLALRFDYGNDYRAYLDIFNNISEFSDLSVSGEGWAVEAGWLALNFLFSEVGFFYMLASISVLTVSVLYAAVLKFVSHRYYWVSFLIYILYPDNMLIQSSAMRQAVAVSLFLISVLFFVDKKYYFSSLFVVFAGFFHTSAFALILVFLFLRRDVGWGGGFKFLLVSIYAMLFVFLDKIKPIVDSLVGVWVERYSVYDEVGVVGSGFGFVFLGGYLIALIFLYDRQSFQNKVIFRLVMIGIYLSPLAISYLMLSRLVIYFGVFSIFTVPIIASSIRSSGLRFAFLSVYLAFVLYSYFVFILDPNWVGFQEYKTVFEASSSMSVGF